MEKILEKCFQATGISLYLHQFTSHSLLQSSTDNKGSIVLYPEVYHSGNEVGI